MKPKLTVAYTCRVMFSLLAACAFSAGAQTTLNWRSESLNGNWNDGNNWWNGSGTQVPAGSEILRFGNSVQNTMANNLTGNATNRFQIYFDSGSGARTISGTALNVFYDFGGGTPLIQNDSANTQTINFPIANGNSVGSSLDIKANTAPLVFGGTISAIGGARTLYPQGATNITFSGVVSNGAGATLSLTKLGAGMLTLGGANTYTGGSTISAGVIRLSAAPTFAGGAVTAGPLGTGTATFADGTTLWSSSGHTLGNLLSLNGNITLGVSNVVIASIGRVILSGGVELNGGTRTLSLLRSNSAVTVLASGQEAVQLSGQTSGPTNAVANGTLRLVADSTVTGSGYVGARFLGTAFTSNSGLTIGNRVVTAFGSGTPFLTASAPKLTVESGGYFNTSDGGVSSRTLNVFSLSGDGTVVNLSTAAGTSPFTINGSDTATFSGAVVDGTSLNATLGTSAHADALISVTKSGAGTQILSGANTYRGATTLSASGGTLRVNGTHTVASGTTAAYTINGGGAILGGSGTIDLSAVNLGVTVNNGGKLSPGSAANTVGTLTLALGSATLNISGAMGTVGSQMFDIAGTNTSDRIVLSSGTLNIGSGVMNFDDFAFNEVGTLQAGTYTLIQTPNTISGTLGGSLSGTVGAFTAAIALSGDSKSVVLTLTGGALPTPVFSNLTPSQTIASGTTSLTLTGNVAASGPVYPDNAESGTVSAMINGSTTTGTFTDALGNFSITFNPSVIPASGTPYTITYNYAGNLNLSPAAPNTSTTLAVTSNLTWTGTAGTDFETGGTGGNWNNLIAPANNLTSHVGVFSGAPTANLPSLSTSRSIAGLSFTTPTGGWTLGSGSPSHLLSLGASGISTTGQTGGTNTIGASVNVGASQTWRAGTGGNLLLTGTITNTAANTNYSVTINASGNLGNVILSPSAGSSITLVGSNNTASILQVKTGGVLQLGGDGVNVPATSSTNIINNTQTSSSFGTWGINGSGKVQVNSGTWLTGDLGKNGSDNLTGTIEVTGGTISFSGARYLANGTISVSGGTLRCANTNSGLSNGGRFTLGSMGAGSAALNLSGGLVDLAQANAGNSIGAAIGTLLNQSGGSFQNGVTVAGGVNGGTVTTFSIGGTGAGTNNNQSAVTLISGAFVSAGAVQGAAVPGPGSVNNFNFMGGTLAVGGYVADNLGSSPAATASANQTSTSDLIGTLVNYGGTLAPGNVGVAGRTAITGNYSNAVGAALAIDLGGTNAATTFTNAAGHYDAVTASGDVALDGSLTVGFINGYVPTGGETFIVVQSSNVYGAFSATNLPDLPVQTPALNWWLAQTTTNLALKVNRAPSARAITNTVAQGSSVSLTNNPGKYPMAVDADDDGLTFALVSGPSAGTISNLANGFVYTNTGTTSNAWDTFTYAVSDGFGGAATNTMSVYIGSALGANLVSATQNLGLAYLTYAGIPGHSYVCERATNLTPPIVWTAVATNMAGVTNSATPGMIFFTNSIISPASFFRTQAE